MKKHLVNFIIFGAFSLPLFLWLSWVVAPSKKTNILIVDKTVLTDKGLEHNAFDWVLAHLKYDKKDGTRYKVDKDYRGFFPHQNGKYVISDLSTLTENQLDSLAGCTDLCYYTDTYGIYYNEWFQNRNLTEHSEKIYGGLDENDVLFLQKMKIAKKLILAEFNFFATPTPASIRVKAENLFGLRWSGWTGRFFDQLDTIKNPDLPGWVPRLYKSQHLGKWPFTKSGVVFIHSDETIVILEKETDLKEEVPVVKSFDYGIQKFSLPKEINYPYWFDITLSTDTTNKVISYYELKANLHGDSILQHFNIPKIFPAVFENLMGSPFYYFCGDFTDSPIQKAFYQLTGIEYLKMFVLSESDNIDRSPFFWRFYLPMTSKILADYYNPKKEKKK